MLKDECSFPDVLCDGGDAPANFLCHSVAMSCYVPDVSTSNAYVSASHFSILVNFVLCSFIGSAPGLLAVLLMCDYTCIGNCHSKPCAFLWPTAG